MGVRIVFFLTERSNNEMLRTIRCYNTRSHAEVIQALKFSNAIIKHDIPTNFYIHKFTFLMLRSPDMFVSLTDLSRS